MDIQMMKAVYLWTILVEFSVFITGVLAVECKKNEDLGDQPENIYDCLDPDKSACCEVEREFTCCEPANVTTLKEQLTLWGTIVVVLLVIIILIVCFRLDISYCSSEKTLKDKFVSWFNRKKNKKDKLSYVNGESKDKRNIHDKGRIANNNSQTQVSPSTSQASADDRRHFNFQSSLNEYNGYDAASADNLPLTTRRVSLEMRQSNNWNA